MKPRAFFLAVSGGGLLLVGAGFLSVRSFFSPPDVPAFPLKMQPYCVEVTAEGTLKAAVATPITAPTDVHERMMIAWIGCGTPLRNWNIRQN